MLWVGSLWPVFVVIAIYLAWVPYTHAMRLRSVPGTYHRYYWNTVEKILRWPAALLPVSVFYVLALTSDPPLFFRVTCYVCSAITLGCYVWAYRTARSIDRDDDDDGFKRAGRWLRRVVSTRKVGLARG